MPRDRVQHQKGLSDDAFERLYPDEEACRKAWLAWRWPEGFKCPRCAASEYREIRDGRRRRRRGHTPFIIAVETSFDGRPLHARLQVVRGFQAGETKRLCARVEAGTTVVSDGGQWFRCIAEQPGIVHERHITGSDCAAARHPAFRWANTMFANIKNSLLATHRAVDAKHLPRYLGAFAWRFNRRFVLKTIHQRLAIAATTTPPMPYRLLKLAEARW